MSTPSHTMQMTSCPQCGSDVMPEMIRCRECGTMLHEQQSAAASSGSLREEKPQNKITTCRNCGEEMRSGMSRCRNCGHVPLGTKPHSSSVKLADSASWAADLFNSVPLEEAPVTLRPTVPSQSVKLADSASWATDLFNGVPLEDAPVEVRPTVPSLVSHTNGRRPEIEKPVPAETPVKSVPKSPHKPRLCPDCQHPLADNSTTCAWCAEVQAACQVAYEQAKVKIAESMVTQAKAAFKAAEDRAKTELAWAFAPNVDRLWWGWMGGIEFGPVEFMQVFALAKNGQLKPSDLIRNGSHGQFFPSSSAPGLLNAVAAVDKASEALELAQAQAQAAAAMAPPPTKAQLVAASKTAASVANEQSARAAETAKAAPPAASTPALATPSRAVAATTTSAPEPATPIRNAPSPAPAATAPAPEMMPTPRQYYSAPPPVARPSSSRPQPKKQSWDPDTAALFKKIMAGSLACVLVVGGFGLKHAFRKVHRTVVRSAPAANSVAGINSTKQNVAR